jgi:hypothetical protein
MRDVSGTGAAVRSTSSTRSDLLLESLALRHQLSVLSRSNRRFRPSDRLLWLLLRWLWPRWREALMLVQPATVDRWHRAGLRRYRRRRSRRPGRLRIDSTCRDLIRRLAAENHLWGAPRIHGELLKLGIAVSERTVSRYLQGRPTARSQTWRTFFANHLGDPFMQPVSSSAPGDDDIVDASGLSCRPIRLSLNGLSAASPLAVAAWAGSRRHTFLDGRLVQDDVHDRTNTRNRTGRDPPQVCGRCWPSRRTASDPSSVATSVLCDRQPRKTIRSPITRSRALGGSESWSECHRVVNATGGRNDFVRTAKCTSA